MPTTGFYEWKQGGVKTPYYIDRKDHQLFAFAGLYDVWQGEDGRTIPSFTIITVPANDLVGRIHERMPAILTPAEEGPWLEPGPLNDDDLKSILASHPTPELEAYPVSRQVNSPAIEGPELIQRAA